MKKQWQYFILTFAIFFAGCGEGSNVSQSTYDPVLASKTIAKITQGTATIAIEGGQGNVFVSGKDTANPQKFFLLEFDSNGNQKWNQNGQGVPVGLLANSGYLYHLHQNSSQQVFLDIYKMNTDGSKTLLQPSSTLPTFVMPNGITKTGCSVDQAGNFYMSISDGCSAIIYKLAADGSLISQTPLPPFEIVALGAMSNGVCAIGGTPQSKIVLILKNNSSLSLSWDQQPGSDVRQVAAFNGNMYAFGNIQKNNTKIPMLKTYDDQGKTVSIQEYPDFPGFNTIGMFVDNATLYLVVQSAAKTKLLKISSGDLGKYLQSSISGSICQSSYTIGADGSIEKLYLDSMK